MGRKEIAQTLADSGLKWPGNQCITGRGEIAMIHPWNKPLIGPWPTADQSEALLERMGLHVVWNSLVRVWVFVDDSIKDDHGLFSCIEGDWDTTGILKGARTHANNAALAWATKNMLVELRAAVKEGE